MIYLVLFDKRKIHNKHKSILSPEEKKLVNETKLQTVKSFKNESLKETHQTNSFSKSLLLKSSLDKSSVPEVKQLPKLCPIMYNVKKKSNQTPFQMKSKPKSFPS